MDPGSNPGHLVQRPKTSIPSRQRWLLEYSDYEVGEKKGETYLHSLLTLTFHSVASVSVNACLVGRGTPTKYLTILQLKK